MSEELFKMAPTVSEDVLEAEIRREVAENTVLIYGKGTREMPMCGFTRETVVYFERYGHPFKVIDVLHNMPKRNLLSRMTDWPTLPKVFIGGEFYGDTDILDPMAESGEIVEVLKAAFEKNPA
jgi:monothiol glutaredoxin